jgi:hypothetical protein
MFLATAGIANGERVRGFSEVRARPDATINLLFPAGRGLCLRRLLGGDERLLPLIRVVGPRLLLRRLFLYGFR